MLFVNSFVRSCIYVFPLKNKTENELLRAIESMKKQPYFEKTAVLRIDGESGLANKGSRKILFLMPGGGMSLSKIDLSNWSLRKDFFAAFLREYRPKFSKNFQ